MADVLESKPLLKFSDDEKAYLHEDGLNMIKKVNGPIYPIILMGDGRAGKSYLASRFLNVDEIFETSDSADSVTEGIDVVIAPLSQLKKGLDLPDADEDMHVMVLDCEGGNNAMAAIRTLVNVFGILIGTEVIYVAGGAFSEASISNLGASLAARSLIKTGEGKLQAPNLVFVVNKNTLKYKEDTLDKSLTTEQKDQGRRENRSIILDTFEHRHFHAIPLMGFPDFEDHVTKLKTTIVKDARPLVMGSMAVKGEQLCGLLEMITDQFQSMNEVSLPSMSRYVIFEGFLKPMANKILKEGEQQIPAVDDYIADLDSKDPREACLLRFDKEAAHISDAALVQEARDGLSAGFHLLWDKIKLINEAMGEQTKETRTETKEILGAQKKVPVGGRGLLAKVQLRQQTVRVQTRTVIVNKRGDVNEQDWMDSGSTHMRIMETSFQEFSKNVPVLFGKLFKKSPSMFQTVFSLGGKFQERSCIIKEGHFVWWDSERIKTPDHEVSGAINFLINHAQVVEDTDNAFQFTIKPSDKVGKWTDPTSFSGGGNREMTFSCEGSDKPRSQWVEAVRKNISFADLAYAQIGEGRIKTEVGNKTPTLAQALWGAR